MQIFDSSIFGAYEKRIGLCRSNQINRIIGSKKNQHLDDISDNRMDDLVDYYRVCLADPAISIDKLW